MKKLILLLINLFLFIAIIEAQTKWQPHLYDGIENIQKKALFFDDFSKLNNNWTENKVKELSVSTNNNQLTISSNAKKSKDIVLSVSVNENKNFEIETKIKFNKGNSRRAFGIVWGKSIELNKFYSFIINNEQNYAINKFSGAYISYIKPTQSSAIKINQYNKLTIRKVDNMMYFFINEILVNKIIFTYLYDNYFGISLGGGCKITLDYFKISEIDDKIINTAPKIIVNTTKDKNYDHLEINDDEKFVEIAGQITDDGKIIEATINGESLILNKDGLFNQRIPIEEKDNIKIYAKDEQLVESEYIVGVTRIVTVNNNTKIENIEETFSGYYYALIIGVDKYTDPYITSLNEPLSDAKKLYNILTTQYTFDKENVILLENPSRKDIIIELDKLSWLLNEDDKLLIFYAGHGYWDELRALGYWLPADSEQSNTANWLRNSTVKDYISTLNAKHILLVADACFSGSIFRTRSVLLGAKPKIQQLYSLSCRKAMTSGNLTEVPDNSLFMKYFCQKLQDNKEIYIPAREIFVKFNKEVSNKTGTEPQYGTIQNSGDEGGDFIFIRK